MQIKFDSHEPERRRKPVTTVYCGCSCCCCCCCLHTVGSLVGAALAPGIGHGSPLSLGTYYDEESDRIVSIMQRPGVGAITVFWWVLCLLVFVCFAVGILLGRAEGVSLMVTGILVLLAFPVLQLASVIITLLVFAFWPRPDKFHQLGHLGKISAGIILGSVAGTLIMVSVGLLYMFVH